MRFIGKDDDVVPVSEQTEIILPFSGAEFLDRGEDHATNFTFQKAAQIVNTIGLFRFFAQQCGTTRECCKQLVVQIIAVCDDHQRGV